MDKLATIQNRFDALAAAALEDLIKEVEEENQVTATGLEVELIPTEGQNPSVEVNLTVKKDKPRAS